jgi:hypothetical protein
LPDGINFGRFWKALEWKMLVYFMVIWNTYKVRPFPVFCGHILSFSPTGMFYWEKIWQPCVGEMAYALQLL